MNNININNNVDKVLRFNNSSHIRPNDNINIINDISNTGMPSGKPTLLNDMNDMNGINLLVNQNKVQHNPEKQSYSPVNRPYNSTSNDISSNIYNKGIDIDDEDNYEDDGDNDIYDENNIIDDGSILDEGGDDIDNGSADSVIEEEMSYEDIMREKQELLFKLEHLNKIGYQSTKRYSMASELEDMRYEFQRLKRQRDTEKSVKFQRKMLMACCSGLEFINDKFDPLDIKLEGWSETMMEHLDDYDEVFEELYEKYQSKVQVAPEIRLITMVGGSAFMFHLTNTLFKTSPPSMADMLKQNPDLLNNFKQTAVNSMNSSMPTNNDPVLNMMNDNKSSTGMGSMMDNMMGMGQSRQSRQSRQSQQPAPQQMSSQQINKMSGPTGVDDILNQLDNDGDRFETLSSASEGEDFNINNNVEVINSSRRKKRLFKPKNSVSKSINLNI
jgi:hypothetical protein